MDQEERERIAKVLDGVVEWLSVRRSKTLPDNVCVSQHGWEIVEKLGVDDWIVRRPNFPLYRVTRYDEEPSALWHVRPYVTWER